jgi:RNA polymerase sigma-70 factor (ECF subfamily)
VTDLDRRRLFGIAYRMLGTVSDAEDVVQDAYVRYHAALANGTTVQSPAAFLATTTTRLAIDHLRSARVRREQYVGEWLPEPILTGAADAPEMVEQLSLAFLVLLESLSPEARAAFVLREVFDYPYGEIAPMLGASEAACRQLVSRAKKDIEARRRRHAVTREARDAIARRFHEVCRTGDAAALERLLAEDATFTGDGGGQVPAAARPVAGRQHVARFIVGLLRLTRQWGGTIAPAEVNGGPGAVARDGEGRLVGVLAFEVAGGGIVAFHSVVNPDKLRHLGPVAGREFFRQAREVPSAGSRIVNAEP